MLPHVEAWQAEATRARETRMDCGWRLAKLSWRLLRTDPRLIALALALVPCSAVVAYADLALPKVGGASIFLLVALAFLATLAVTFVQVMLALSADDALDGSSMTLAEAGLEARERIAAIVGWAAIATAVQLLLVLSQALPDRIEFLASLAASAWGFGIVFVVPMLALLAATPGEALAESPALIRRRWGEVFAGFFGIGGVAFLAAIPVGILIAAGAHRNEIAPGSADLAVVIGALLAVAIVALATATGQILTVALYRDAAVGFPSAQDYVERRPRRKSWIVRIGLFLLAGILALTIVAAILGPRPRPHEQKVAFPATYARLVTAGMPVVYDDRKVGEVTASAISGGRDIVSFEVESPYDELQGSSTVTISAFEGAACLVILPRGQAPPAPGGLDAGPA